MKLSIGIVGLPNVGKSTLFKALTKQEINIANYPFATIDPNVGVVPVPDERLHKLAEISNSEKTIPAVVEFYDIAGLVRGASTGEGLGNQFLSHIKEVNAIVHVVRVFPSSEIIHVDADINPIRDIDTINTELILKDLDAIEKKILKVKAEAKTGDKAKVKDLATLDFIKFELDKGVLVVNMPIETVGEEVITELGLLTAKPQIFLLNGSEENITDDLIEKIKKLNANYIVADLKQKVDLGALIRKAYETLNLISFFTTGEMETRAWTIVRGWRAPQAAGVIHTDFENKFIRAEVVSARDFIDLGGWNKAKEKGKLRIEGRDYAFEDGDVVLIRHS